MISETAIMDVENLPDEIAVWFDRPWNFVGEVKRKSCPSFVDVACRRCSGSLVSFDLSTAITTTKVALKGYLFITDDMIEVTVYFGVCETCGSVYWAREGPPFKRARCYGRVGAT